MRQVSNDIARDLRTPLARLLHRFENVRRRLRTPVEYEAAIDRSICDATSILDTFAALLRIVQIEAATGLWQPTAAPRISHMTRLFRPLLGTTPAEYRNSVIG